MKLYSVRIKQQVSHPLDAIIAVKPEGDPEGDDLLQIVDLVSPKQNRLRGLKGGRKTLLEYYSKYFYVPTPSA